MKKKIALFGGSFNPSTRRHLEIGKELLNQLSVDEVWYLVSPQNPFKAIKDMAPFNDRIAMANLNVKDNPYLIVSAIEQKYLKEIGGNTINSADTLHFLKRDFPYNDFLWVVGADNFVDMHNWRGCDYIIQNFPIIVVPRIGFENKIMQSPIAKKLQRLENIETHKGWLQLNGEGSSINATICRSQLSRKQIPSFLRPSVSQYALCKQIYNADFNLT